MADGWSAKDADRVAGEVAGPGGLEGLRRLSDTLVALEARRTRIVGELRSGEQRGGELRGEELRSGEQREPASWAEIGDACGMTRQGATRRWSRKLHAASFDRAAAAYQRGRPPYPAELVPWAVPAVARKVLDLGAGTGKLTRLLADAELDVVAVEPAAAMREQLAAYVPEADVLDGTAEMIPLPDASVDAVVVAQAWHWVDPVVAGPEVARVLRPGGTLSLVWNIRDHAEPWVAVLDGILHQHSRQEIDSAPEVGAPFRGLERTEFRWRHPMTRAGLLDMVASRSYVIVLPEEDRAKLMREVTELLDTLPAEFEMPYVTYCTRARR